MVELEIDDDLLEVAANAAIKGGNHAKQVINDVSQERKVDNTIVTEADKNIDEMITTFLTNESPHPVLSEESGGDEIPDTDTYWVLDPIDGTQNYAYQQPMYGTAVALISEDKPTHGCFYMPEHDYLYYARDGHGAYRNKKRLNVLETETTENAYLTASGYNTGGHYSGIAEVNSRVQKTYCALQSQAFIASGSLDAGVFGPLYPWDFGAGAVLIREAGGVMKDMETGSELWDDIAYGGVVGGNEAVVDAVIEELLEETIEGICNGNRQATTTKQIRTIR